MQVIIDRQSAMGDFQVVACWIVCLSSDITHGCKMNDVMRAISEFKRAVNSSRKQALLKIFLPFPN